MIESEILSWIVHGFLGGLSFEFTSRFLRRKFLGRSIWIGIFIVAEILINRAMDLIFPYNSFAQIFPTAILIFLLQRIFFEKDLPRQIFLIVNFIAAWEILKFLASPMSAMIFRAWNPIFERFAYSITDRDLILNLNRFIVFGVLIICRATQLGILAMYLRFVAKNFPHEHKLTIQDSRLLALPCIAVLIIDLTIRLMAFSIENGAAQLIYDRVPSTMILLPISSLLLIGVLASHITLFRSLIRRFQLENQTQIMRHDFRDRLATIQAYARSKIPEIESIVQIDHEFPKSIDSRDIDIILQSLKSNSDIQIRSFIHGKIFIIEFSSDSEIKIDPQIHKIIEKYHGEIESDKSNVNLMLVIDSKISVQ